MFIIFFLRCLTWFKFHLKNLKLTHPGAVDLIDSGVLGAARTPVSGLLCDIDRTIKETFMKFAKGSGTFVSPILLMIYFH